MEIFAHRGDASRAPENTLAAFRAALEAGADGIELDVHLTRDGQTAVIHDEALGRTTGAPGQVGEHTLAELKKLDAGSWFSPAFAGEPIPTLPEVLELVRPSGCRVNVELKTNVFPYPGLVPVVLACIAGLEERMVLSSFNHETLAEARGLAPELEYAALLEQQILEPWSYARKNGFRALHPHHPHCTPAMVAASHAAGIAVRPYTVDTLAVARRLFAAGVDGVFTNLPVQMVAWRGEWGGESA